MSFCCGLYLLYFFGFALDVSAAAVVVLAAGVVLKGDVLPTAGGTGNPM